jgi:hypothetical protein
MIFSSSVTRGEARKMRDLATKLTAGKFTPVRFTEADIAAHTSRRYTP